VVKIEICRPYKKNYLIDLKCRNYAVLNFIEKITSLDIFVQICVDQALKMLQIDTG
jgi:hypothetical protein